MSSNPFVLLCYAQKKGGLWIAACPQFTLAAQGVDFDEAKGKLEAQIKSYIVEALTVDREHAAQLLGRQAPLLMRLQYRAQAFWSSIRHGRSKRVRFFEEPALQYVGC
ncbi:MULTISPECIES: hypothetical protein [unclassified Pseudomonas]|uniref:hypothetical protein n=1 Tax=unclassified Pseudomonas TaxID=196821 RepID=UPI00191FBCE1|nr:MULTISPECIES: hypothetical protein [unclassified Pseudomonas]MBL0793637.1 hypothetical protein [Pseudomonas sp. B7]UQS13017.1 hypothetical protein JJN09_17485 [Pseudomonas sp. HS6]